MVALRFLILGASGMAGHMIGMYLSEKGHHVTGFDKRPISYARSIVGDAFDTDMIKKIIMEGKYDSVINCIGLLNQFADKDQPAAVFLNSYLPHLLASITQDTTTQIIQMSTDCVFSGKRGKYAENDCPDGPSFYDRSKALGELNDGKNLTLRNSIVGPDINPAGIGLLNWFMQQTGDIKGYTNVLWTGLTTLQLAKIMEQAAIEKAHGLYNMVYEKPISKYDLLQLFNKFFRDNKIRIVPDGEIKMDKSLIRTRFDFSYIVPDYSTMVEELAFWIDEHQAIYPHYFQQRKN